MNKMDEWYKYTRKKVEKKFIGACRRSYMIDKKTKSNHCFRLFMVLQKR